MSLLDSFGTAVPHNGEVDPGSGTQSIQANSNQIPAGVLSNGVLTVNFEVREGEWFPEDEHGPSVRIFALAEQGKVAQVPGPMIRVPVLMQGVPVSIRVTNHLNEPTSVHWHGIELQSYYDGVPGWTGMGDHVTPMIQPGKSFDVYFNPPRPGTFIYHTHLNDMSQISSGLYGPIIVLPPGETFAAETDRIFVISRNGMRADGGLLLNGAGRPEPQKWIAGQRYRLRFININANNTTIVKLTQKGVPVSWKSLAKDGADLPPEQTLTAPATLLIAPGETYDFEVRPERDGDMELTLDQLLLKEKVTQTIRVAARALR